MSKAKKIMQESASVKERAEQFTQTIRRNLKKSILDPLVDQREKLEDELASILDFSLEINVNKGLMPITREDSEKRFARAIQLEYDLKLLRLETEAKTEIFNTYFDE